MTSKELVHCAIERKGPGRLPLLYCNRDFECSDVIGVGFGPAKTFSPREPGESEWGFVWAQLDHTMGQPHKHPLADWSNVATYTPPDPYASGRFAETALELARAGDKFVRFCVGISGFNQATFLRGFEAFLMDLYAEPERAEKVLDLVFDFENALIDQALRMPIDCVAFGDDWGTQQGLMISLDTWREVFRPRYAEQFARIRRAGKKVWFHSCGDVFSIIDDLIDIGVDVVELLQPDLLGVARLAEAFGGRVCFCCSVDHQRRAISGTRDEIFSYAEHLRDTLAAFNGGFIGYIEDYASLGMSEQNYQWIREAFHRLNIPEAASSI